MLLLLPPDFFSPPWLLRLLPAPLLAAPAVSPDLLLLSDDAVFLLPLSDLPEDEDDFELPDFMEISFGWWRPTGLTTAPL